MYQLYRSMRKWLFIGVLGLLVTGCGAPEPEGFQLKIDQKYLDTISKLEIWVLQGKPFTCQAMLDDKSKFDPKAFASEKKSILSDFKDKKRHQMEFKELKPGKKMFIAAGYTTASPDTPVVFGCQEGEVEAGKKLNISLYLVPFK